MAITQVTSVGLKDGEIVNADLHSSAAIAGSKISPDFGSQNVATTGTLGSNNLTITSAAPALLFTETNGDPDYKIQANAGVLKIVDNTNSADRLVVNTNGHIDVTGNLDVGAGVDVTGNITVSGTVDGVDIAARNTLFGGLTSSSGVLSNGVTATTQSASDNSTKVATTAYADTAVSNLVDSAPGALNTLNELAAALGDDANFSTTVTNSIATKAVLTGSTNNTICTVTGANAITGETNLTFDGSTLDIIGNYSVKDPSTTSYVTHTFSGNFAKIDVRGTDIANSKHYLIGYGAGHGSANQLHLVNIVGNLVLRTSGDALTIINNKNVGIGETVPDRQLHVKSGANSNDGALRIESANDNIMDAGTDSTGHFLNCVNADPFRVKFAGTEKLRINADGELGVGTTNPDAMLHVKKTVSTAYNAGADSAQRSGTATINIENNDGSTNSFAQIAFDTAGSNQSIARIVALRTGTASNALTFVTEHSNSKAERLRIQSDGNIGVGGTAPNYQLHCTSGIGIGGHGLNNQQLSLTNNAIQSLNLGVGYTSLLLNKDGGNVGIGVASAGNKLDVAGGNMKVSNTGSDVKLYTICNTSGYNQLCFGDTDDDDRGSLLYNHVNDNLQIKCATEEKLRITPTVMSFYDGGSERLQFGTHGELGVCGAGSINYGSSGQVLTSGGSSAGMQWKSRTGGHGVLEQFFTVCDGSTIALPSGNITVQNVTEDHALQNSWQDLTGSTISYTPPSGTKQVIFEFHYYGTFKDPNVIWHHKLFLDSNEVTMARGTFRANEAFTDRIVMRWGFNIGGTANTASGRVASWTSSKTIKLQAREFGSSSEAYLHRIANWNGSTTDEQAPDAAMPCIGITAIG